MTKHQDLDIENMTQTDILNVILKGDRISIEFDGIDGLLTRTVEHVRKERQVRLHGPFVALLKAFPDNGMTVTRIERPIPEPELPTVPGYYESAKFPLKGGYFALRLNAYGEWYRDGVRKTEEQMREHMPLARLVPESAPAKLADRIDPESLAKRVRLIGRAETYKTWTEDAETLIAAIDNGELDK